MTSTNTIALYDFPLSIYCQMARVALAEKGARYETRPVDITQRGQQFERWYLDINPRGVVPSLVIDGEVYLEAKNILRRIDELLAGPSLIPERDEDRARMDAWMPRSDGIDYAALLYATKLTPDGKCPPLLGRLARLREVRARYPELAGPIDPRIEELVDRLPKIASATERAALRTEVTHTIRELDTALAGRSWLGGDTFSLADVMWTATLARCEMHGITPWAGGALPNVARYYAALKRRPSFREANVFDRMPETVAGAPKSPPQAAHTAS